MFNYTTTVVLGLTVIVAYSYVHRFSVYRLLGLGIGSSDDKKRRDTNPKFAVFRTGDDLIASQNIHFRVGEERPS